VADYLKSLGLEGVKIKWPNDVLVDEKKTGGILIENSLQGEAIQKSIVGIGLNINQKSFAASTATSLALVVGKDFDVNTALNSLLTKFESRYLQLRAGKYAELKKEYLENLFGLGEQRTFTARNERFSGIIQDVNEKGELIISVQGNPTHFSLKEISFGLKN
jgi:BirA family biotin operon repressor/biotin-[acetyl-CoA-carboxylase] ligase